MSLNPQHSSPVSFLADLAVEGASGFIEAQRIFLNLAQQENDLLRNGVKERVGGSPPAVAATDLVGQSLDALIAMQHEFLTTTSKQTLQLLDAVQTGKYDSAHVVDIARDGMESFVRANRRFLDVVMQETIKATSGKGEPKTGKKKELSQLARQAGELFMDAQKKILDVVGHQMTVNVNAMTQAAETISPARLISLAEVPAKAVKNFIEAEASLLESVIKKPKVADIGNHRRRRSGRQKMT